MLHLHLTQLISQYGSFALFGLLAFGIIGLPIPDETLLIFSGVLIARGNLSPIATCIAAVSGSMIGITVSFILGRTLGYSVIHRFGKYVGITDKKLDYAHNWFERFGKWLIFIGYFIPGVRHFTGLSAGVAKLEYLVFAIFAYSGALVWSLLFIGIGYFFFNEYQHLHLNAY